MDILDQNVATSETFWGRVFDIQSQHPVSKKTDFPIKHEFVSWEYTRHNDATDGVEVLPSEAVRVCQKAMLPQGLSTTRFHRGFQRRKQSRIGQDDSRLQREAFKQHLSLLHLERRRQRLGSLDKRNGFNLITGEFDANRRCTTPFHVQPRTRETGSLSEVAERAEYLLLRDSKYKFHAPAWSGKNHDQRQDLLQREGLNKPKKSTLLGIGSADLASAGAHDMFSKAIYDPAKACTVEGLVETCIPGRYTPRKVAAARKAAAAAASHDHVDAPPPQSIRETSHQRAVTSPASLGTVFRVVPNGLGNHSNRGGRGGATVAGIAPFKRLCGSRSTPILLSRGHKAGEGTSSPPPTSSARSASPGGGRRRATGSGGEGDRASASNFAEKLLFVTGGSGRRSGGLTRSQSDFGGSGCAGQTHGLERACTAPDEAVFVPDPASENRMRRRSLGGSGSGPGSARSSRGPSPAERRKRDQLALDLAAIRSL